MNLPKKKRRYEAATHVCERATRRYLFIYSLTELFMNIFCASSFWSIREVVSWPTLNKATIYSNCWQLLRFLIFFIEKSGSVANARCVALSHQLLQFGRPIWQVHSSHCYYVIRLILLQFSKVTSAFPCTKFARRLVWWFLIDEFASKSQCTKELSRSN